MKRLALISLFLLVLALAVACGAAAPQRSAANSGAKDSSGGFMGLEPNAQPMPAAMPTSAPAATAAVSGPAVQSSEGLPALPAEQAQAPTEPMVVYNGTMKLEVNDTEQTVSKIVDILKGSKGYVANRSLDRDQKGNVSGSIVIRIPSGSLEPVLTQIRALALKVLHEDAKSEDVTQEYVDLDARRKNLESYEAELTQLLDTMRERTNKASDLLDIYNQLTSVRGQIEQIKGRQNYLQNTSSFATYTIQFVPHVEVEVVEPGVWSPGTTAREALRSLVSTMQGLADIGITFTLFVLPVLLVLVLPFVILFLIVRRLWRGRRPAAGRVAAS